MSDPLARLVAELARLPGIGPKTATRLAHHLLRTSVADVRSLTAAMLEVKEKLFHCSVCNAITAVDPCRYCTDPGRQRNALCVVEEPFNILPIERTGEFRGLYHCSLARSRPSAASARSSSPSPSCCNGSRASTR